MHITFESHELELLPDNTWYVKCPNGDALLTELPPFLLEKVKFHLAKCGIISNPQLQGVHYESTIRPTG